MWVCVGVCVCVSGVGSVSQTADTPDSHWDALKSSWASGNRPMLSVAGSTARHRITWVYVCLVYVCVCECVPAPLSQVLSHSLSCCIVECVPNQLPPAKTTTRTKPHSGKGHCLRAFLYPVAGGELNKVVLAGKLMDGGLGNIESIFNSLIKKKQKETSINSF